MLLLLSAAGLCSCSDGRLSVVSSDFGTLSTGEQTTLYTLTNRSGARMTVCDYGARIVSIQVPDRNGELGDVVVGYGDIASFEEGAETENKSGFEYPVAVTESSLEKFTSDAKNTREFSVAFTDGEAVHVYFNDEEHILVCSRNLFGENLRPEEFIGALSFLFSNPDTTKGRNHLTIKASLDGGNTWLPENRLLLDEGEGWGYSCLTMIDGGTVGILYESSVANITFQAVRLEEIIHQSFNQ